MTRTISLITATVGAALLFAVPAWGDNWGADKAQPTTTTSPDWFERAATVAIEKQKVEMLNARERSIASPVVADPRSEALNRLYGLGEYSNRVDLRERALVEKGQPQPQQSSGQGFDARSDGLNRLYGLGDYAPAVVADDRFRIDYSDVPVSGQPTSTGNGFEWPQVGIGLGVALALILGLILTLKATHSRPFAH